MTTRDALLNAIYEADTETTPGRRNEASPSLVFADWLAENGEPGQHVVRAAAGNRYGPPWTPRDTPGPGGRTTRAGAPPEIQAQSGKNRLLTRVWVHGPPRILGQEGAAPILLTVAHQHDDPRANKNAVPITHTVPVHDRGQLRALVADFHPRVQARIFSRAFPHLPEPAGPKPEAEPRKLSRQEVDARQHDALIRAVRAVPYEDKNTSLVFADHLQDHGIPGAHVVRAAAGDRHANREDAPRHTLVQSPYNAGLAWYSVLGPALYHRSDRPAPTAPIVMRVGHDSVRNYRYYDENSEPLPEGHSHGIKQSVGHQVPVRTRAQLLALIDDFPEDAKARIVNAAYPHLPADAPEKLARRSRLAVRIRQLVKAGSPRKDAVLAAVRGERGRAKKEKLARKVPAHKNELLKQLIRAAAESHGRTALVFPDGYVHHSARTTPALAAEHGGQSTWQHLPADTAAHQALADAIREQVNDPDDPRAMVVQHHTETPVHPETGGNFSYYHFPRSAPVYATGHARQNGLILIAASDYARGAPVPLVRWTVPVPRMAQPWRRQTPKIGRGDYHNFQAVLTPDQLWDMISHLPEAHRREWMDTARRHGWHRPAPQTEQPQQLARVTPDQRQTGLGGAARAASTDSHDARLTLARQVLREAGLTPATVRPALHVAGGGVRPAAVVATSNSAGLDHTKYAAAWYGMLAGEPALNVFHPGAGEDLLHVLDAPVPGDHAAEYFRKAGLPATVEHRGTGSRVYVLSNEDVGPLARGLNARHSTHRGTVARVGAGESAGPDSGAAARAAYRAAIRAAESAASRPGSADTGPAT